MNPTSRLGTIMVSVTALSIFGLAIAASAIIAYFRKDYTLLVAMAGVAATNATTVVGYWVGSSDGSAKKTALLGQTPTTPTPTTPGAIP